MGGPQNPPKDPNPLPRTPPKSPNHSTPQNHPPCPRAPKFPPGIPKTPPGIPPNPNSPLKSPQGPPQNLKNSPTPSPYQHQGRAKGYPWWGRSPRGGCNRGRRRKPLRRRHEVLGGVFQKAGGPQKSGGGPQKWGTGLTDAGVAAAAGLGAGDVREKKAQLGIEQRHFLPPENLGRVRGGQRTPF